MLDADFNPTASSPLTLSLFPVSHPPTRALPVVEEVLDVIMKCVQQQDYDILSLTFNFWYLVADGVEYETGAVRQQLRELRTAISRAPDPTTKAQLEAQIPQVTATMYQVFPPTLGPCYIAPSA